VLGETAHALDARGDRVRAPERLDADVIRARIPVVAVGIGPAHASICAGARVAENDLLRSQAQIPDMPETAARGQSPDLGRPEKSTSRRDEIELPPVAREDSGGRPRRREVAEIDATREFAVLHVDLEKLGSKGWLRVRHATAVPRRRLDEYL